MARGKRREPEERPQPLTAAEKHAAALALADAYLREIDEALEEGESEHERP